MPNKNNTDDLYRIAAQVRNWAEGIWYRDEANDPDLTGCCVIASTKLLKELKKEGFDAVVHITETHGYVCVGKYVVDVTATQFDFEDVVLIKPKSFFNTLYHSGVKAAYGLDTGRFHICDSVEQVIEHQKTFHWPENQSAITYIGEM